MRRRITVGLVAAVAALGIASCGGDDDEDTTTTSSTTTTTTTEAGATGATGAADSGDNDEALVDLLVSSGEYTEGEAQCLVDVLGSDFTEEQAQDPEFIADLATKYADEIQECDGK